MENIQGEKTATRECRVMGKLKHIKLNIKRDRGHTTYPTTYS